MIKQKVYFTFFFTIILTIAYAQKSVNQYDKNGKRHGIWTKNYYKTDQKRYQGTFKHGKEIDTFNYYTLSKGKSVLSAIKVFNEKDSIAEVTFYTSTKKIISKGKMNGKRYIGKWVFYHKNSSVIMIVEHYNDDGKLEGEREVYFKNGNTAEKAMYKNGKLHGESSWYSESNKLLRRSTYINGDLNGKTINYDADENITSEGYYTENKKSGIWKYYKDGKITKEIDHTNQKIIKKY
ncbi:toxin-antitoxin system YwqK family antitoxin [Winogradskyella sp.]|jgi:antitoxin component YwqK of YwqJK toxin-antitoxin module|uniref:toxin-antitoxin system YwqK family antitoxin n=1 Tax=Winogradskyella sp. TaxID=1883156 RepID=UPI0025CFE116|nr:toxin-antitoxin system YwqK family antitoxin [Winogradskyella sp.]MCT4628356.1 toxin-antitoxin system YwqK family antitoxin [Winogradskyella sp.]